MFDIDTRIQEWRRTVSAHFGDGGDVVDELEGHLRDDLDRRIRSGVVPEQAWADARARLGDARQLAGEFAKVSGREFGMGRARTYLKKLKRGVPIAVAVCLVLSFSIRWAIAEPFYVPGEAVKPSVPQGSRILVYKLATVFRAGDVVAFRNLDGETLLAIVKTDQGGVLTVSRNGEADRAVPRARVIGRVVANTR